jgi:hypothetical protein
MLDVDRKGDSSNFDLRLINISHKSAEKFDEIYAKLIV